MTQLSLTSTSHPTAPRLNPGWLVPFIVLLISLLVSGFAAYTHNDKELVQRVTIVETKQSATEQRTEAMEKRLERIEDKLDRLIDRLSKP